MGYFHSLYDTRTFDMMKKLGCDYSGLALDEPIPKNCMDLFMVFYNATVDVNVYNIFGYCYGLPNKTKSEETNQMHLKMPGFEERGLV